MTRTDFESLSQVVRKQVTLTLTQQLHLATDLAMVCSGQNERFNHDRFYLACGFEKPTKVKQ